MQVTDSHTPTLADVKRQLKNTEHELSEIVKQQQQEPTADAVKQTLFRVREAIAHITSTESGA